jgi:flagellar hook protein FlgE
MTTAFYTATSGIMANQMRLNVISNNIANVNTLGFKSSSVNFATVFANTISGGSAPNGTIGGTNPKQVGNGTMVYQIATNFGQGGTVFTGRSTDLYINGNGFFCVERNSMRTGNNQTDYYLTRAGNFSLDANGNLVTASGDRIRGTSQVSGNSADSLGRVQIPQKFLVVKDFDADGNLIATHFAPVGTDEATIEASMDPNAESQTVTEVEMTSFSVGPDGAIAVQYSNGDVITVRLNQATVDANPNDPSKWRTEIVHIPYEGGTYASSNVR